MYKVKIRKKYLPSYKNIYDAGTTRTRVYQKIHTEMQKSYYLTSQINLQFGPTLY